MRNKINLIVMPVNGITCVHFCKHIQFGTEIDANELVDLWIPIDTGRLFESIEQILFVNKIAHNLVSLNEVRTCGLSKDYEAVFNVLEKGVAA
ncbi:hypothetical protein [Thiomicrorhabdus indica]|uniref:hypothetical protein n=1 Tax=Thiomicrorhabdus indica TaxID=2267253 RepID=UPI00102DA935|nr:hypothetical protein [Thiomicrorhabdus indica]